MRKYIFFIIFSTTILSKNLLFAVDSDDEDSFNRSAHSSSSETASVEENEDDLSPSSPINNSHKKIKRSKLKGTLTQVIYLNQPSDKWYKDAKIVSKNFLKKEKIHTIDSLLVINNIFAEFKENYTSQKKSKINITGLSSRARINLLRLIIEEKLNKLPDNIFDHNLFNNNYWKRYNEEEVNNIKKDIQFYKKEVKNAYYKNLVGDPYIKAGEIYDMLPTTFIIESDDKSTSYEYKLRLGPRQKQRGSGKILGLFKDEENGSYAEIIQKLNGIEKQKDTWDSSKRKYIKPSIPYIRKAPLFSESELNDIPNQLINQKKDGKLVEVGNPVKNQFLNGFNLLLDYEIARKIYHINNHPSDPHEEYPFIFFLKKLIKSFRNIPDLNQYLAVQSKEDFIDFLNKENLLNNNLASSPFSGERREEELKKTLTTNLEKKSVSSHPQQHLREKIKYLHKSEEDSSEGYSTVVSNSDTSDDRDFLTTGPNDIKAAKRLVKTQKEKKKEKPESKKKRK